MINLDNEPFHTVQTVGYIYIDIVRRENAHFAWHVLIRSRIRLQQGGLRPKKGYLGSKKKIEALGDGKNSALVDQLQKAFVISIKNIVSASSLPSLRS